MSPHKETFVIRNIQVLLIVILFIKIGGYFSINEQRSITQVFKIISRIGMTAGIIWVFNSLRSYGCIPAFTYQNRLAIFFYSLYLLLGFASFMWSSKPTYSALQWFMTVESLLFVLIFMHVITLVNYYLPEKTIDLIKLFSNATFPFMVIFAIGSFTFPDLFYREMRGGAEIRLGGWIMNPNELGMLASIAAAFAYLSISQMKHKVFGIVKMTTAIVVLVLTSSRSSALGFILIMGIMTLYSDNKKLKVALTAGALIAIPALLRYVVFKEDGGVDEVLSMTGRIPFWTALLQEGIVKEPWFGFGFMRINYTDDFQGLGTYPARMTHNTFMQVLMNLGFVGYFIAMLSLVLVVRNFITEYQRQHKVFFIALFIPIFINSITEFGIFGDANYGILFFQFLLTLFLIKIRKQLTTKERIQLKVLKRNRL